MRLLPDFPLSLFSFVFSSLSPAPEKAGPDGTVSRHAQTGCGTIWSVVRVWGGGDEERGEEEEAGAKARPICPGEGDQTAV